MMTCAPGQFSLQLRAYYEFGCCCSETQHCTGDWRHRNQCASAVAWWMQILEDSHDKYDRGHCAECGTWDQSDLMLRTCARRAQQTGELQQSLRRQLWTSEACLVTGSQLAAVCDSCSQPARCLWQLQPAICLWQLQPAICLWQLAAISCLKQPAVKPCHVSKFNE